MPTTMTLREMNLKVFTGERIPHVFFQPIVEPWYDWHRTFGRLPERYRHLSVWGFSADLGTSMRYVDYYTGMASPVQRIYGPEVWVRERTEGNDKIRIIETPRGELEEHLRRTTDETWRTIRFPVRGPDDFGKLSWLLDHTTLSFSEESFMRGGDLMADRGEPQFCLPRSPYLYLSLELMRFEDMIYALADYPAEIEAVMAAIDRAQDRFYEELIASGLIKIANFGENVHQARMSPRYFERYLIPWYEKRAGQLRRAGIYSHVHIDGYFRSLLPYLKDLPFEGLEALTPEPQGDVTLEEIKEHIGDKVLLDGIPAVMFLPTFSEEELMATVERLVQLFHPRLVLGVSDEVPEGAPEEAIERVRRVSQWCRAHN